MAVTGSQLRVRFRTEAGPADEELVTSNSVDLASAVVEDFLNCPQTHLIVLDPSTPVRKLGRGELSDAPPVHW
jgi:hypothetical protein